MFHGTSARIAYEAWARGSLAVRARRSLCDVDAAGVVIAQQWLVDIAATHQTTVVSRLYNTVEDMAQLGMEFAAAARASRARQCVVVVENGDTDIGEAVVIATATAPAAAAAGANQGSSRRRRVGDAAAPAAATPPPLHFEVVVMSWGNVPWPDDDLLTAALAAQLGPDTRVTVDTLLRIRDAEQPGKYQAAQTLRKAERGACAETMIAYAMVRVCVLDEPVQDAVMDIASLPATQLVVALHAFVEMLLLITIRQLPEVTSEVCERYLRPAAYLDTLRPAVRPAVEVLHDVHNQLRTPAGLYTPTWLQHSVLAALSSSTRHRLVVAARVRALARPFVERSWQGVPVTFMRATELHQLLVPVRELGTGSFGSVRAVMVKTRPGVPRSKEVLMQTVVNAAGEHVQVAVVIADKDVRLESGAATDALTKPCLGLVALEGWRGSPDDAPEAGLVWKGSSTPWRELAAAAVLTRLVERCISPHVSMQYAVLPVLGMDGKRHVRTLMEVAGEDLYDALQDFSAAAEPAHYMQSINVLLWQVLYTLLAAHVHARVRHNDLHLGNVLVSSVAAATDVYVVATTGQAAERGLGRRVWRVPNMGMCAKLIDWGFVTSPKLFGRDDHLRHSHYAGPLHIAFNIERTGSDVVYAVATELQDAALLFDLLLQRLSRQHTPAAVLKRLEDAIGQCVRLTRTAADPAVRAGMEGLLSTNLDEVQREAALAAQSTAEGNGLLAELLHWWGSSSGFDTKLEPAPAAVAGTCFVAPGHGSTWDMTRPLFGGEAPSRDGDTSAAVLSLQGGDDGAAVAADEGVFGLDPFEARLFRAMEVAGHTEVWPIAPCPQPVDREEGEEDGDDDERDGAGAAAEAGARAGAGGHHYREPEARTRPRRTTRRG